MSDASLSVPRGGVIFDMDGLMLDTESIAKVCWERAFALTGRAMTPEVYGLMIGRNKRDCAELLRESLGADFDFEATYSRSSAFYEEHVTRHGAPLKAGVLELLRELAARDVPLAVATSTRKEKALVRLKEAGLLGFFAVVVGEMRWHTENPRRIFIRKQRDAWALIQRKASRWKIRMRACARRKRPG